MKSYSHIASMLLGEPLAIAPEKLGAIMHAIGGRLDLDVASLGPAPTSPATSQKARAAYRNVNGVAAVNVFGSLTHRPLGLDALSGMSSYQQLGAEIAQAAQDPNVRAILLIVDSAGGEVAGVFDLADQIAALRGTKPIVAIAEDKALSAAYCIAAACDQVYATQAAQLGSIGVVLAHVDESNANAKAGKTVSLLSSGARKLDGHPARPLTEEARAAIQGRVDKVGGMFAEKVAGLRGLSSTAVKDQEAGVFTGDDAVAAGLADGISTTAALLEQLASAAAAPTDPLDALEAELAARNRSEAQRLTAELDAVWMNADEASRVLQKHIDRGALLPTPALAAFQKLAQSGVDARELDRMLAAYPSYVDERRKQNAIEAESAALIAKLNGGGR